MKIVIGGGAGFIGSSLIPALLGRGYKVKVIDLFWFGDKLPEAVEKVKKDLFDCTEKDFEGCDQFIFLAGLSNDPMAEFSPSLNFKLNGALPAYLAYVAKKAGVKRFIYASSCSVYGYTLDKLYDEESPTTCDYPYGISKLQGERGCMQMQDKNFSVIALRQGTVCGYSPRMRYDLIINTMFKNAASEGYITVNNPSIWRPILDIRDAVSAYLRSIQADYSISGVFNVASENYTVGQIGDIVQELFRGLCNKNVLLNINNVKDMRNYKVSVEKAKTNLGFFPYHEARATVLYLLESLANKLLPPFDDKMCYNISVFKEIMNEPSRIS